MVGFGSMGCNIRALGSRLKESQTRRSKGSLASSMDPLANVGCDSTGASGGGEEFVDEELSAPPQ